MVSSRAGLAFFLIAAWLTLAVVTAPVRGNDGEEPLPAHARGRLGTTRYRAPGETDAVALSPNGRTLAVAGWDRVVLFDGPTGRKTGILPLVSGDSRGSFLTFCDAGRKLLFVRQRDVQFWEVSSGKRLVWWAPGAAFHVLSYSADGRRLAITTRYRPDRVTVIDVPGKKELAVVTPLQSGPLWAALSPDGTALATGGGHPEGDDRARARRLRQVVQVWDLATGQEKDRFAVRGARSGGGCYSPDGTLLATAGPALLQVRDAATGVECWKAVCPWFRGEPAVVGFSADGKYVHAADRGGQVGIWEAATGREVARRGSKGEGLVGVGYLPNCRPVAWGKTGSVLHVWDPRTGEPVAPAGGALAPVHALGFTPDSKVLFSLDEQAHLVRWDPNDGRALGRTDLRPLLAHGGDQYVVGRAAFAPDGKTLVLPSGRKDYGLVVVPTAGGKHQVDLVEEETRGSSDWQLTFSADGSKLAAFPATTAYDKETAFSIPIWERGRGKRLHGVTAHLANDPVRAGRCAVQGAVSPDGRRAAVATVLPSRQDTVHLTGWDLAPARRLGTCVLPSDGEVVVAMAGDGRVAVVRGSEGRLVVCDVVAGRTLGTIQGDWKYLTAGPIFSQDGRTFAIATAGGKAGPTVRVIEWATWSERCGFGTGSLEARSLACSPDGVTLAAGYPDSSILLWDLTGRSGSSADWSRKPTPPARLWERLRGNPANEAFGAMQELTARSDAALAALRANRKALTLGPVEPARVSGLISQLGADRYAEREAAMRELTRLLRLAEPQLRDALADRPDLETRRRLERLLDSLDRLTAEEVYQARCVEVLERIGSAAARSLLRELAKGPPATILAKEAAAALRRLER